MNKEAPAPLDLGCETVKQAWTDYNGHLNVAYYVLAFDHAVDRLFDGVGLGPAHVARGESSLFVLESHVTYQQELLSGDPMRFTGRLLDLDHKRLHAFLEMHHAGKGFLAATYEFLALHVDLKERCSMPFSDTHQARFAELLDLHSALPWPQSAGSRIGIRR